MSVLIKAGAGLLAGLVAGVLGVAFIPAVGPETIKPRRAVEKPQFVAPSPSALAVASQMPAPVIEAKVTPPAPLAPPSPMAKAAPTAPAAARWSVLGLSALAQGDLAAARAFLTRASEAGDPRAFVALADTYDPAMLQRLGVVGSAGDAAMARAYLAKAAAAGVIAAKERMVALEREPATAH